MLYIFYSNSIKKKFTKLPLFSHFLVQVGIWKPLPRMKRKEAGPVGAAQVAESSYPGATQSQNASKLPPDVATTWPTLDDGDTLPDYKTH